MKLSLCIATFNEESNIHYPLDSAYDFVDEVVIIDGGSTDKTVEKAKSYGHKVKVFIEPNPAMFHINKQKAIERAKGEWILQLDADEALSDELKTEIQKIVHRNFQFPISPSTSSGLRLREYRSDSRRSRATSRDNSQSSTKSQIQKNAKTSAVEEERSDGKTAEVNKVVAYNIPRKNWFLTRFLTKGGQYPDYTIRLYRNGAVRFPCKDVHENVELISKIKDQNQKNVMLNLVQHLIPKHAFAKATMGEQVRDDNETIEYLKNPILHYADPTFSRYLARWDRYATLEAMRMPSYKLQVTSYKRAWLFIDYFIIKPKVTFLSMYFRHKGFMDGFPGFVFALFSSIRFWAIYIKWQQSYTSGVK